MFFFLNSFISFFKKHLGCAFSPFSHIYGTLVIWNNLHLEYFGLGKMGWHNITTFSLKAVTLIGLLPRA